MILFFAFLSIFTSHAQIIKQPIPDKLVVLTFDDAPASHYTIVAPMLMEYGFGGTFFVCEFQPNYSDSTLYMNWRQIQELDKMGFEIANHTHTHSNVSKLSQAEFNHQLTYIESKCDSLGIPKPTNFAYPGYGLNAQSLAFLGEKEYVFARAGGSRVYDPVKDHPFLIPSWATDETNKAEIMKAFNQAEDGKIVVLTIHGVPDIEHPWVNTLPELFKGYLQYLKENDFTVISMRELEDFIDVNVAKRLIKPDFSKKLSN
ncbi:polysaccharide deacetylase family protein [Algoriphagus ratkowskyi]|uniref:Polysaccharide deacetylase family protein n=1 Tax=Algoriphagus ratkowskyi TaxID=57028 RepID=A0ABY3HMR3_9BACT|nr:polysaccharide deacetylase family protein [Algoriphagus ratkowskyi]TXD76517.1 polysaccharide deacetylase family protein [Algoriphagus ratkowskyi]